MSLILRYRTYVVAFVSTTIFCASYGLAFLLRFDFAVPMLYQPTFLRTMAASVLPKVVVFYMMGLYTGWWRYVGMRDLVQIVKAVSVACICFLGIGWAFAPEIGIPRSIYPLDWILTVLLSAGARAALRAYREQFRPQPRSSKGGSRTIIVGAGDAGEMLVREIRRHPETAGHLIGFVDDDRLKLGAEIHGLKVLGNIEDLPRLVTLHEADTVIIAVPSASGKAMRHIVDTVRSTGVRMQTLPSLQDLVDGRVEVSHIRDVDINDLLGREPVQLDNTAVRSFVSGKVVLITGAGGSIGSELARTVVRFGPRKVLMLDQAENPLFWITHELDERAPEVDKVPIIADVVDRERMRQVFIEHRPQAVFHAAAHKHVGLMEHNPGEAVKNNVLGTKVVADLAGEHGAEAFVMISTDKAVKPSSFMGATKRIAEHYVRGLGSRFSTRFLTVRFGNVLGSAGSVIPIFKEQIRKGGPVTVTDPDMRRFFMTIPEACQLVLQAAAMGHRDEIFVLDMGKPILLLDLARDLIRLSNLRPGEDIEIVFVGPRPGEKLFEELHEPGEELQPTHHPKIRVSRSRIERWEDIVQTVDATAEAGKRGDPEEVARAIRQLLPDFRRDTEAGQTKEERVGASRPALALRSSDAS